MAIVIVTGSAGLIGSETVKFYGEKGYQVVGIDNNLRKVFFGEEASTEWKRKELEENIPNYIHQTIDIRDETLVSALFKKYNSDIELVVHTAAQPSHDWAATDPFTDFSVNATGTLNLLEAVKNSCPESVFIFTSTNKVYGDRPNALPLHEGDNRYELDEGHKWYNGIDETMSIDQSKHSLFGVSKAAADLMVQEYGRYFGLKTGIFRGGCLTGPSHSGTMLHGFLSYLMKCCITGKKYSIYGYNGKQVRDNIHSFDLVNSFDHFFRKPGVAEVFNMGGSRHSNVSMKEAIALCEEIAGKKMAVEYVPENRSGDHIWWISDVTRFKERYPEWDFTYNIQQILEEIFENQKSMC